MKIGYPCINRSIGCTANRTFRLANYSEERLIETVSQNLSCLKKILEYNVAQEFLFFRISSDLIPFASHPVNRFEWNEYFRQELQELGNFIKASQMRISMHPDQFVLINALDPLIVEKSIAELAWQCLLLTSMGLDRSAKVQIHVGGVYGNKEEAINRFIKNYLSLPVQIRERLVIENDDRLFSLADCLKIHQRTGIPVLFDNFHHCCLNNGETVQEAMVMFSSTWQAGDGIPMTDYSSQAAGERKGKHTEHIETEDFKHYLQETAAFDFDIMLEIKDKESSAREAVAVARSLNRLNPIHYLT